MMGTVIKIILVVLLLAPQPPADARLALQRGLDFLKAQYNPELRLLHESPNVGHNRYYLTNDNALATYALETLKAEPELAKTLRASLQRYQHEANGLIEITWGQSIDWPPAVPVDELVLQQGADTVLNESHYGKIRYQDWADYANLSLMYCLYRLRTTNRSFALADYRQAMQLYDGRGFADKAYRASGAYETYKLAWAIYVANTLGVQPDPRLRLQLRKAQDSSGGFRTHYLPKGTLQGDPNVETTALALLALGVPMTTYPVPPGPPYTAMAVSLIILNPALLLLARWHNRRACLAAGLALSIVDCLAITLARLPALDAPRVLLLSQIINVLILLSWDRPKIGPSLLDILLWWNTPQVDRSILAVLGVDAVLLACWLVLARDALGVWFVPMLLLFFAGATQLLRRPPRLWWWAVIAGDLLASIGLGVLIVLAVASALP